MTAEEYLELKRGEERLQREADRAQGAVDQLHARLKAEFGVATEAEGHALQAKLEKELVKLEREANAALAKYRQAFSDKTEGKHADR